jgi:hypothetical protein
VQTAPFRITSPRHPETTHSTEVLHFPSKPQYKSTPPMISSHRKKHRRSIEENSREYGPARRNSPKARGKFSPSCERTVCCISRNIQSCQPQRPRNDNSAYELVPSTSRHHFRPQFLINNFNYSPDLPCLASITLTPTTIAMSPSPSNIIT